jgi:uncharacterized protein
MMKAIDGLGSITGRIALFVFVFAVPGMMFACQKGISKKAEVDGTAPVGFANPVDGNVADALVETGNGSATAGQGETGNGSAAAGQGETGNGSATDGQSETGNGSATDGLGETRNGSVVDGFIATASTMNPGAGVGKHAVFYEFPITAIRPEGWLKTFLENQRDGLTGHIDVAGFPFNTDLWASDAITRGDTTGGWAAYEQTAFYVDGLTRVALLLRDKALLDAAKRQIDYVLEHPDTDGSLGPKAMKDQWPRVNFFRALMAWYESTGDSRIPQALARHYSVMPVDPTLEGWGRSVANIEHLGRLYEYTGDSGMILLANKLWAAFEKWNGNPASTTAELLSDQSPNVHGPLFIETLHIPAVLYMYSGEKRMIDATINGYQKLERDHMLVDGVFSSQEYTAGKEPRNAHETCTISDWTYNTGYVLLATGGVQWADSIERAALNAGIGAIAKDFKSHQYFSSPNQVISTRWSSHIDSSNAVDDHFTDYERSRMAYRPGHPTQCCTGNVHRIIPAYVARMWLTDNMGGLVAALYGPSSISAYVGQSQQRVTVEERTEFPFSDEIEFVIQAASPITFPLILRVPSWTDNGLLTVNGVPADVVLTPGTFVTLEREFAPGDVVKLTLPSKVKLTRWPEDGIAVERGPIVFSLGIAGTKTASPFTMGPEYHLDQEPNPDFPQWEITPDAQWNYALAVDETTVENVALVERVPEAGFPWDANASPIRISVPARIVAGWQLDREEGENVRIWPGDFFINKTPDVYYFTPHLPSPVITSGETGNIELIPYGSTYLRLTIFPVAGAPGT